MFCTNCGQKIKKPNQRFCTNCGNEIKEKMYKKSLLKPKQAKALKDLEDLIGEKFLLVQKVEYNTFGVKIEGDKVVGLGLYNRGLSTLPESISNLSSLKELSICDKLTTLPESIGNLSSLQNLSLKNNNIKTLPESIGNLSSLQNLSLKNNNIKTLPESIGNLTSLQELDLSDNKFTTLPESIENLKLLEKLDLGGNNLTNLPETIGNLESLQELLLFENKLRTLPESIGNLTSLQKLFLSYNQLSTLPKSIGNLESLQELDLESNKLSTLPESITNLKSLKMIYLSENKWKGKWEDMEGIEDVSEIFELCRKLHGIVIFISHAMADQKQYSVRELKKYLEKEVIIEEESAKINIIREVYLCEVSFIADIEKFMEENIPKSHLLIFISTKNSLASEACRKELFLARKFGIKILPIKGTDISWENLSKIDLREYGKDFIDLSKLEGFDFVNFNDMCVNLRKYIEKKEFDLKKSKKGVEVVENTKKNLVGVINSKEFRALLKDNFEDFNGIFQELNRNQITPFKYLLKLGQILNKKIEN